MKSKVDSDFPCTIPITYFTQQKLIQISIKGEKKNEIFQSNLASPGAFTMNKAEHAVQSNAAGKGCIILFSNAEQS